MKRYSHPGCFANIDFNCSRDITKEHVVSRTILESFELNNKIAVAGFPWQSEAKSFKFIGVSSLVSKILCRYHNNLFSKYDSEAGRFFDCIRRYDAGFSIEECENENLELDGRLIEYWMLKTVCGFIASKQTSEALELKPLFIDILLGNQPMPEYWGLYYDFKEQTVVHKYNSFSFMPLSSGNELKGAELLLHNFKFYLLLGKADHEGAFGMYHPFKFFFKGEKCVKSIQFKWQEMDESQTVTFHRIGTTTKPPDNWEEWMKA
jgi:hypothetical protein